MSIDEKTRLLLNKYLEEYQQLSKRLQEQTRSFEASLKPTLKAQRLAQEAIERMVEQQRLAAEFVRISEFKMPDLSSYALQAAEMGKAIERAIFPAFKMLQQAFRDLPPRTQRALLLLAEHGWYLDLDMPMPEIWELEEALAKGEVNEAEEALCEYLEKRIPEIEKSISEKFPHRAHLIRAAFGAHRREEYILSIPVLLAQTDGICKDVMDQYLFRSRDKKPRTAKYVERWAADSFRAALLSPLTQTLPISASKGERVEGSDALNRHTVMHGEDLGYGSKKNGLKAISLLNYVAHVAGDDGKKNP
jgi:hypothetical protein